jgi:hypothetical protein
MVKAVMYRENFDSKKVAVEEVKIRKQEIDAMYDKVLDQAIEFCNSDLTMPWPVAERTPTQILCHEIKANMKK